MAARAVTRARRGVAAALLFWGCAALAGVMPTSDGIAYRAFGLPEGIFALLLSYLLVLRGVWERPTEPFGWLAIGYGTLANAQALELLIPPPGVLQWVVVTGLAIVAWGALGTGSPQRTLASLGSLALLLALLRYSVVPVLWDRLGPRAGAAFGLGDLAEGARRFLVDYQPLGTGAEIFGFLALCAWAAGTRVLWQGGPPDESEV